MEEGLLATVVEQRTCTLPDAEAFVADLGEGCATWLVYHELQELCAPRMLVDKTPTNASHPLILRRACEIFTAPYYLHLVRHPYAAIESGVHLQRDILGHLGATWDGMEDAWVSTNIATRDFLLNIESAAQLMLRWTKSNQTHSSAPPAQRQAHRGLTS